MTATIYICGNTETLLFGSGVDPALQEPIAVAAVEAGTAAASDAGCEPEVAHSFRDWHGGKFSADQCGRKIGADTWGHCGNFAATLERNPSPELIAAVDAVDDAMRAVIAEEVAIELAEAAAWRAEQEERDRLHFE